MEDDYYFDDMGMDDYGPDDITYEQLVDYLENYEGEITPEMLELLEAYKKGSGQNAMDISRIPVPELIENCVLPSCTQAMQQLLPLFFMCALFRFFCYFNKAGTKEARVPPWLVHLTSAVLGIMVLRSFFSMSLVYLVTCCGFCYFIFCLVCAWNHKYCGLAGTIAVLVFSLSCELLVVDPTTWHKIRGLHFNIYTSHPKQFFHFKMVLDFLWV
ncbi:protein-serine O-palmitoleoyltransferase porcupine-like [Elysia marginata]|uniref:Protein-serine O-palmitoleoyltransferase porcupine-like n=1 Tax=Elysia marginata TaxID=1093978 RepID=A0AAV4F147_9GAST|nr:protein-serine O-palmitoleoyltransferase porcupine-like [Elysia marginata]